MPRKYAGPLQPGKRSAYVPGSRKNKPSYSKKRPARLSPGKTSYYKSRKASSKLVAFGETKIQGLRPVNFDAPLQLNPVGAGVAPVYGLRYVIGETLPQYPSYTPLGGMLWPRGQNADERIGNYMYFRRVNLTMEINMDQVGQTNSGPRRFRVIIFKARRYANPTGTTSNPNNSLLLKDSGESFGVDTTGPPQPNMLDFSHQITNKRDFTILKDQTFILQNPLGNPSASVDPLIGGSGQYKSSKIIRCNLPLWRKTIFNNETNRPQNLNYNYGIYIHALNVGAQTAIPDDWTLSLRGTVSANDV